MKKTNKKYFIKDESLKSVDNDYFRHQDIADNMRRIIDNTVPPFNIAIIGKWGLGKSSLINLVLNPMRNDRKNYIVQEINAWKYEKDEIGKAFLKQLWQGISDSKLTSYSLLDKEYSRLINDASNQEGAMSKKTVHDYIKNLQSLLKIILPVLFITFVLYAIYTFISFGYYDRTEENVLIYILLNYCKNMGTLFFIPLLIWFGKIYLDNYNADKHKKIEINYPLQSKDDYEIYLEEKMKSILSKNPDIKIITVIDDLDRLSSDKMIEALDTLKVFMNFKQCVFIVPFDDEIIKKVLDTKKNDGLVTSEEFVIHSELILDKLFQYKIYLPQLIKGDIKSYAVSICNNDCVDFIKEYIDGKLLDLIIRNILIHSAVSTPRQVKKIMNIFISNVMIARSREHAKKVEKGFSSSEQGLKLIAKISVLQADFNEFYDLLFKDSGVIDDIIYSHRKSRLSNKLLEPLFIIDESNCKIKKQHLPLMNFLINTEKYSNNLLLSYLYMAQDEISILTGDKKQQDFISAIESSNFVTVKDLLNESPILTNALINYIRYSDDYISLNKAIIAGISIIDKDYVITNFAEELVEAINERIPVIIREKLTSEPELIDWYNVITALQYLDNKENIIQFISDSLNWGMSKDNFTDFDNLIESLLSNFEIITDDLENKLAKKIINYISYEESDILNIISWHNLVPKNKINTYFGIEFFDRICNEVINNNNFSEIIVTAFKESFALNITKDNINDNIGIFEGAFSYPALHIHLIDVLKDELASSITEDKASDITRKLIAIDTKNQTNSTYKLLSLFTYKIEKDDAPLYDDFFKPLLTDSLYPDMLLSFGKSNSFSLIPNSIQELIDTSLTVGGYDKDILKLLEHFTSNQSTYFWSKFNTYFSYTSDKDYKIGVSMFKSLHEVDANLDKLLNVFENVILQNYSTKYTYENYFSLTSEIAVMINNDFNETLADKFANLLVAAISTHIDETISLLKMISIKNSEQAFTKYIGPILSNVNKDNFKNVYYIVKTKNKWFTKENGNLTLLVNFYLDNAENTDNPLQLITDLNEKFSSLSSQSIENLIHVIIKYEIDINKVDFVVSKFINIITGNKEALNIVLKVLASNDELYYDKFYKLFKNVNVLKAENLKELIAENEYSSENLLTICKLMLVEPSAIDLSLYFEMLNSIISKNHDVEINEEALYCIQKLPANINKGSKQEISELSKMIFNNTSSDKVKKNVVDFIKLHKLNRSFKQLLNDDELKEFAELIK